MYDVLIIGSGAAGLTLALSLPESCKVAVLSKDVITEGSTVYAQGGISAVLDATDSVDSHIEDTLNAGAGLWRARPSVSRWKTGEIHQLAADAGFLHP